MKGTAKDGKKKEKVTQQFYLDSLWSIVIIVDLLPSQSNFDDCKGRQNTCPLPAESLIFQCVD